MKAQTSLHKRSVTPEPSLARANNCMEVEEDQDKKVDLAH